MKRITYTRENREFIVPFEAMKKLLKGGALEIVRYANYNSYTYNINICGYNLYSKTCKKITNEEAIINEFVDKLIGDFEKSKNWSIEAMDKILATFE